MKFRCDWVAVLDIPCLNALNGKLLGPPKMLTRAAYRPKYTTLDGIDVEDVQKFCPHPCNQWTSGAALALAGFLHADRIDVYGGDFGRGPTMTEFDGFVSPEANYSPERWDREYAAWCDVREWLRGRGVAITEHGAAK